MSAEEIELVRDLAKGFAVLCGWGMALWALSRV